MSIAFWRRFVSRSSELVRNLIFFFFFGFFFSNLFLFLNFFYFLLSDFFIFFSLFFFDLIFLNLFLFDFFLFPLRNDLRNLNNWSRSQFQMNFILVLSITLNINAVFCSSFQIFQLQFSMAIIEPNYSSQRSSLRNFPIPSWRNSLLSCFRISISFKGVRISRSSICDHEFDARFSWLNFGVKSDFFISQQLSDFIVYKIIILHS